MEEEEEKKKKKKKNSQILSCHSLNIDNFLFKTEQITDPQLQRFTANAAQCNLNYRAIIIKPIGRVKKCRHSVYQIIRYIHATTVHNGVISHMNSWWSANKNVECFISQIHSCYNLSSILNIVNDLLHSLSCDTSITSSKASSPESAKSFVIKIPVPPLSLTVTKQLLRSSFSSFCPVYLSFSNVF